MIKNRGLFKKYLNCDIVNKTHFHTVYDKLIEVFLALMQDNEKELLKDCTELNLGNFTKKFLHKFLQFIQNDEIWINAEIIYFQENKEISVDYFSLH